jgi:hypothetical protein
MNRQEAMVRAGYQNQLIFAGAAGVREGLKTVGLTLEEPHGSARAYHTSVHR